VHIQIITLLVAHKFRARGVAAAEAAMEHDLETGSSPSPAPAAAAIKPELVIACTFVSAVVFIGAFIAFYPQAAGHPAPHFLR
jgi:hypothetical protein